MPVVPKTYKCTRCGRPFTKYASGAIMSPSDAELAMKPLCDDCKNKRSKPLVKK